MNKPVRVTITGAAGQIGYQLAFRIASGQLLGPDRPVILQLLEIQPALPALNGVVMELADCAFPTLAGVVATDDAGKAFRDSEYALLVGKTEDARLYARRAESRIDPGDPAWLRLQDVLMQRNPSDPYTYKPEVAQRPR